MGGGLWLSFSRRLPAIDPITLIGLGYSRRIVRVGLGLMSDLAAWKKLYYF